MHHARVTSMTSEDQDHDQDYSDDSSNEASQENGSPAKRRRVSQSWVNVSCQLCKTRKVKCDRTLPSCGWCTRNNAACEYKERKKPGLRAGYGRELEQRLDKLEGILLQHSEVLARVLSQVPNGEGRTAPGIRPQQQETSTAAAYVYHGRRDSFADPYSSTHNHREFAPLLPPISTASSSHDRRPSVSFMNNPVSSPPVSAKASLSQSPPAFTHGVLKHHSTSPQYAPLLTPNITTSSGAHSPQHDYISSQKSRRQASATPPSGAQSLQSRYPFHSSLSSYTNDPLPPWPVMYELAVLYFTNIHPILPLISEETVFKSILDPQHLGVDTGTPALLKAITVIAMRFLPPDRLTEREKDHHVRKCREQLSLPGYQRTKEGTQALAVLLLGSNRSMGSDETAEILGQVNERLHQAGGRRSKPQSPLSVNEMLCPT